jgi:hypothetical protein
MVCRTRLPSVLLIGAIFLSQLGTLRAGRYTIDPTNGLAFMEPWVDLEQEERDTLSQRGVIVRSLPASDQQISVIAVCPIALSPEAFLARVRSPGYVNRRELKGGRFGNPPSSGDLAGLSLDPGDIERLKRCVSGDCALNLADSEMSALQVVLNSPPRGQSTDVHQAFRQVVLNRLRQYQAGGLAAVPEYHDREDPVRPAAVFSEILRQTPYLKAHVPRVLAYLQQFPSGWTRHADSSMLWSKMMMNGKAVVMVTHLTVFRPDPTPLVPAVILAGKQVYASRYMNGDLRLTMLFADGAGTSSYLVHVNRSHLDELNGRFSGIKRAALEGPIKAEAAEALAQLRDRLERDVPPARRR